MKCIWQADDGTTFENENACHNYEVAKQAEKLKNTFKSICFDDNGERVPYSHYEDPEEEDFVNRDVTYIIVANEKEAKNIIFDLKSDYTAYGVDIEESDLKNYPCHFYYDYNVKQWRSLEAIKQYYDYYKDKFAKLEGEENFQKTS